MKSLTIPARLYILGTLAVGGLLMVWQLAQLRVQDNWLLLAAMCALAALTQVYKVLGTTSRSSYNISWMVYAFTFILLGVPAAILVILVAHLVEWPKYKYVWYIQSFNIATYVISTVCAHLVGNWVAAVPGETNLFSALGILAAMATFTLVNHLMIGIALWTARAENFAKSGVFGALTLMIDFSLLCLGAAAALIWMVNAPAALLTVIPLYLFYSTLRVPALERQTDTDAKTGLFNARYFTRALEKQLASAARSDLPLTVVVADLDLLRNINNTYGHLAGDAVLIKMAQILQDSARMKDVVSRFGGEEFAILLPDITPEQALERIEALRAAIQSADIDISTSVTPIRVTMSFGIAGRERPDQSASEIVHNADVALYHSKLKGRNRVSVYTDASADELFGTARLMAARQIYPAPEPAPVPPPTAQAPSAGPARPPEQTTAPPSPKTFRVVGKRPAWMIQCYLAAVALIALAMFALSLRWQQSIDWLGLVLFVILVALTEWLAIDIYVKDTSISLATVPHLAGALLFGPAGALVLSVTLAGTAKFKHGSPVSRFVFNTSNHLITSLLCVGLFALTGVLIGGTSPPTLLAFGGVAAGVVYIVSTLLLAIALDLDTGQPARQVWSERFRWLAPSYLVMGVVASILVFSYQEFGTLAALSLALPLFVLRLGQKQFIDRTTANVSQLRFTNTELLKQAQEISALNEELLLTLAHAFDMRDPYVMGHSNRVAQYAVEIARELQLAPERVEFIRKAALLHDIGKLGVPESILFKPDRLSEEEFEHIRRHPSIGADILSKCRTLQPFMPIVQHHHERYDGQGYPTGLRNEQIPLDARIVGLADAVEAMVSDRPYRPGMSYQAVFEELRASAGTQFDPLVVDAFCRVLAREGESLVSNKARAASSQNQQSVAHTAEEKAQAVLRGTMMPTVPVRDFGSGSS